MQKLTQVIILAVAIVSFLVVVEITLEKQKDLFFSPINISEVHFREKRVENIKTKEAGVGGDREKLPEAN